MSLYADIPRSGLIGGLIRALAALLLVALATIAGRILYPHTSPANLVMLYLFVVVLAALKLGRRSAVLAAVAGAVAFDLFFVPSTTSTLLLNEEYFPIFLGLLMISLVISSLVATAQERAESLHEQETETATLYRLSRELSATPDQQTLYAAIVRNAEIAIASQAALFHALEQMTTPVAASNHMTFTDAELSAVDWSYQQVRHSLTPSTAGEDSGSLACLPLVLAGRCMGVLALRNPLPGSNSQRLVEGFIAQTASALQRIELAREAEQASMIKTRSNFERALLNSISHDLRTPLASITGTLSTLQNKHDQLSDLARRQLLDGACSEADRLNRFVTNLLDMTRIDAGVIELNLEPCEMQELVGCALHALDQRIGTRKISVELSETLPLVSLDLVLMTQVLMNLLDNSLKYSPEETAITISAHTEGPWLVLAITDEGPGIPEQDLQHVFDKFYRIPIPEGAGGTGLGLSICKGIVEAHGGQIYAENNPEGGLRMLIRLAVEETA